VVLICFILVFGFEVCWVVKVFIGKLVFDCCLGCGGIVGLERVVKKMWYSFNNG
jgi:hypothetical protein